VDYLNQQAEGVPLWVKVSPGLAREQYQALMKVFAAVGVRAVVATNTHAEPTPDDAQIMAGVGGARLHAWSIEAARTLMKAKIENDYAVDVVGCGGIQDSSSQWAFARLGVKAFQYWSGLVYRGPLAGGLIHYEVGRKDNQ
jgi:dihydroorotate dehydrogenase